MKKLIILTSKSNIIFKSVIIIALSLISIKSDAQSIIEEIEFDTFITSTRLEPESIFNNLSFFEGLGDITFFEDSIIVTYTNEWETRKHLLFVDTTKRNVYKDKVITTY